MRKLPLSAILWKPAPKPGKWTMRADELERMIQEKPDFLSTITAADPIQIRGAVNLCRSEINHLSEHVTFENKVNLSGCPNLKVAEGTFRSPVDFSLSGIERIGKLVVDVRNARGSERLEQSMNGMESAWKPAASFRGCRHLRQARGTFLGAGVDFSNSGVEEILSEELHIDANPKRGGSSSFQECVHLKIARGTFPGHTDFSKSGVEKIDTHPDTGLIILGTESGGRAANFCLCKNLKVAEGSFPGSVYFTNSGLERAAKNLKMTTREGKFFLMECEHLTEIHAQDRSQYYLDEETQQRVAQEEEKRARARKELKQPALEL